MPNSNENFPALEALGITITYGGLFILAASSLAKQWSAIASLIFGYLIFIAPFVMGAIAYKYRQVRSEDDHRPWVFYAGASYFVIAPITIMLLLFLE